MTDPNKAAVTESNAEFIARMNPTGIRHPGTVTLTGPDYDRLIALAEERVMIEEHILCIQPPWYAGDGWSAEAQDGSIGYETDISTALHAVVAKIGEGNG